MTTETVTPPAAASETLTRPAAKVAVGDRIAAGWLPLGGAATVLFAASYHQTRRLQDWVLVVYRYDGDETVEADHFLAAADIPLERLAADDGFGYSREADDPAPVSPARVPLHTGSVVDGGVLVTDEPEGRPLTFAKLDESTWVNRETEVRIVKGSDGMYRVTEPTQAPRDRYVTPDGGPIMKVVRRIATGAAGRFRDRIAADYAEALAMDALFTDVPDRGCE